MARKKPKQQSDQRAQQHDIVSIPDAFYGGKNPNIYETGRAPSPPQGPRLSPSSGTLPPTSPSPAPLPDGPPPKKKKTGMIIVIVLLFLIVIAVVSVYYINQAQDGALLRGITNGNQQEEVTPTPRPTPPLDVPTPQPEEPEVPEDVSTSTEDVVTSTENAFGIDYPGLDLIDTVDLDFDGLTDLEEEIFDTDSGNADTDGDGYRDGLEVENLYNPGGFAPLLLSQSGLVREYVNPAFQYRFFFPLDWAVASVDAQQTQVLVSASTGDYIEILAEIREPGESFNAWFADHANGEDLTEYTTVENRFNLPLLMRRDQLVGFVITDTRVYAIVYHPGPTGDVPFRSVMYMLMQGFRLPENVNTQVPEQVVLPGTRTSTISATTTTQTTTSTTSTPL